MKRWLGIGAGVVIALLICLGVLSLPFVTDELDYREAVRQITAPLGIPSSEDALLSYLRQRLQPGMTREEVHKILRQVAPFETVVRMEPETTLVKSEVFRFRSKGRLLSAYEIVYDSSGRFEYVTIYS